APAEIIEVFAEVCGRRRIPGGGQRAAESVPLLEEPAKCRDCADFWIRQRPDQMRQPAAPRASVGVAKNKNVVSLLRLLYGRAKVVHFFAASFRTPGDYDVNFVFAGSREFVENLAGGVLAACHREKNVIIGIIKRSERSQIFLEPGLDAFDGANQG